MSKKEEIYTGSKSIFRIKKKPTKHKWSYDEEDIKRFNELKKLFSKIGEPTPKSIKSAKKIQSQINRFYKILGLDKSLKVDGIIGKKTKKDIIEVQRFLKRMKYYKGRIDGVWGKLTQNAYENFMEKYKIKKGFSIDLKFGVFYPLLGDRIAIFIQELKDLTNRKYNVDFQEVLGYLKKNKKRINDLYKKTMEILSENYAYEHPNKELVGQVVLSAVAAEFILKVKAEITLSIAINETHLRNLFGKNGQGVMQITRNSSVSYLKGTMLDKVNDLLGGNVIMERIKYNEIYAITPNVFAGVETFLMKMVERGLDTSSLNDFDVLVSLAKAYNGHPKYKNYYGSKFLLNYIRFS